MVKVENYRCDVCDKIIDFKPQEYNHGNIVRLHNKPFGYDNYISKTPLIEAQLDNGQTIHICPQCFCNAFWSASKQGYINHKKPEIIDEF